MAREPNTSDLQMLRPTNKVSTNLTDCDRNALSNLKIIVKQQQDGTARCCPGCVPSDWISVDYAVKIGKQLGVTMSRINRLKVAGKLAIQPGDGFGPELRITDEDSRSECDGLTVQQVQELIADIGRYANYATLRLTRVFVERGVTHVVMKRHGGSEFDFVTWYWHNNEWYTGADEDWSERFCK